LSTHNVPHIMQCFRRSLHDALPIFVVAAFVEEPDELQVLGRVLATHGESPLSRHPSSSSSRQRPGVPSRSFPPDASPPEASFPVDSAWLPGVSLLPAPSCPAATSSLSGLITH